jgi:hypothetical protein
MIAGKREEIFNEINLNELWFELEPDENELVPVQKIVLLF